MASDKFVLAAIASVLLLLPCVAVAKDYVVGDEKGWTNNFDYQAWAKDKVFYVGDRLVFEYTPPNHNVFKVDATAFKDCAIPSPNEAMKSGHDVVELKTPGKKWYICGVGEHCAKFHQKLVIDVVGTAPAPGSKANTPAPAPFFHIAGPAKSRTPAPSPSMHGHMYGY